MTAVAEPLSQGNPATISSDLGESLIRDIWPSVAAHPGPASLARACYRTTILAPIGWLILAPIYFQKLLAVLPGMSGMATRYRLTNRRLMICKGMRAAPEKEVRLDQIQDVRLTTDANSEFFIAGNLDIVGKSGQTILTLPGVPEAESVRHAILQAVAAWGPLGKPA